MGNCSTRVAKVGVESILSVLGMGATAFVYNGRFHPETYLELLQNYQINVLCCTPTEYRMMAKLSHLEQYNLEYLHSAVSAGEPLNREVVEQFKRHFNITVRDGYGQTESTLLIGFLKILNHVWVLWAKVYLVVLLLSLTMMVKRLVKC